MLGLPALLLAVVALIGAVSKRSETEEATGAVAEHDGKPAIAIVTVVRNVTLRSGERKVDAQLIIQLVTALVGLITAILGLIQYFD